MPRPQGSSGPSNPKSKPKPRRPNPPSDSDSDSEPQQAPPELPSIRDPEPEPEPDLDTPTPIIPPKLLARILSEFLEQKKTKISNPAVDAIGEYSRWFVREAVFRARLRKGEEMRRRGVGGAAGVGGVAGGFLDVEDLERVALTWAPAIHAYITTELPRNATDIPTELLPGENPLPPSPISSAPSTPRSITSNKQNLLFVPEVQVSSTPASLSIVFVTFTHPPTAL